MEKIIRRKVSLKNAPLIAFDIFASYGFMVIILFLLLVLTFLGTIEQTDEGLYRTQQKYFNSLFLVHDFFDVVPIPLPGGYLLMAILFLNLLTGALIRARKNWREPGMLIAHGGILFLLLGGFVTFHYSTKGNMALFEGERSDQYQSYVDWVIEIAEVDEASDEVLIIPTSDLEGLKPAESRTFYSDGLPFDIEVSGYRRNAMPTPTHMARGGVAREIDGYFIQQIEENPKAEQNIAAAYVTIKDKDGGKKHEAILWGGAVIPYSFKSGGKTWTIGLAREKWKVPFTVVLRNTTRELHPGTQIPAKFSSDITKIEGDTQEEFHITMNAPLRHKGYTFFQENWGMGANNREFSQFSVVRNPADHWPLYACIIVSFGLLVHFTQKLVKYIRRENRKRAPA